MARRSLTIITFAMSALIAAIAWSPLSTLFWSTVKQLTWSSPVLFRNTQSAICPKQSYRTSLLSTDPLMIYVEEFVTETEINYFLDLQKEFSEPAKVYPTRDEPYVDREKRFSMLTFVDPADSVMQCVGSRAIEFQGSPPNVSIEDPYVQRYETGGHFTTHFDWIGDESAAQRGSNRFSTFLIYLESDCTEGGTNFPRIPTPALSNNSTWCDRVYCKNDGSGEEYLKGTTFKPVRGNAVFWINLDQRLKGHVATLHRGLPLSGGVKTVMNLFTAIHWDPHKSKLDLEQDERV